MSLPRTKLIAYTQLMRLPNLFTAAADPLAGWLVIGGSDPTWQLVPMVGASVCLYTSGIVFNDCFDYELDCLERPERPLPSGAILRKTAWMLGAVLMVAGLALAALVGGVALGIALFLSAMIFFYNAWAKRIFLLGPLAIGACRFANFLLGMRSMPVGARSWMPVALGCYVVAVTFLARREVEDVALQSIVKRLLLGIIVLDAAFVATRGDWLGAALVLSLLVPAVVLAKLIPMT